MGKLCGEAPAREQEFRGSHGSRVNQLDGSPCAGIARAGKKNRTVRRTRQYLLSGNSSSTI